MPLYSALICAALMAAEVMSLASTKGRTFYWMIWFMDYACISGCRKIF